MINVRRAVVSQAKPLVVVPLVLVSPVWLACMAAALGFFPLLVSLNVIAMWIVAMVVALIGSLVRGAVRYRCGARIFLPVASVAIALALGIATMPVAFAVGDALVSAARRPARESIALRLIERCSAEGDVRDKTIDLPVSEQWVSDFGDVRIDREFGRTSVTFTDLSGIMSGDFSVYSSDASSVPPVGYEQFSGLVHDGGHWWSWGEE